MVSEYYGGGGGDTGFTSDSEGANANLDISMSEDSARNLWDVQAAIQQISVDFQSAVRAASDFNSYLISIRETSQTVKMPTLGMEGGEGGNMSYSGGRVDSGSVPGAGIQSEIGMASRIGEMEENQSGAGGGAMAARATNTRPVDVGGFVNQATQAAWLASSLGGHQGGGGGAGSRETQSAYEQEYQYALSPSGRYDPRVTQAIYGGQVGTPRAYAASQVLSQGLPAAQQFLGGGGAGGFARIVGGIGTVGAIGYSAYQLGSAGLETYAQSRSMGIATGNSDHGAGWGFGRRLGQAAMAMSPFVSSEEAGQIYSSAIDQGWASRNGAHGGDFQQGSFGQAIDFMYNAAKDNNMSPEMSAQLLQNNSLGAGVSVQALAEQLLTLKQSLDGTGVSVDAANSVFTSFTSQLISAGAGGGGAAIVAGGALNAFAGNSFLGASGRGAQIIQQTLGSQQTQNVLAGMTGTIPGAALAGNHLQQSLAALDKLNSRFAQEASGMSGLDPNEKAAIFMQMYNSVNDTQITAEEAGSLMAEYVANPNKLVDGEKQYQASAAIDYNSGANGKDRNAWDRYTGAVGDRLHEGGWMAYANPANYLWPISASVTGSGGWEDTQHSFRNYSPKVDALLNNSADSSKVTIVDDSGKVIATGKDAISQWFADENNFKKFSASGSKYKIHDANGGGADWDATNIGGASGNTQDLASAGATDANTIYITLSPQAKQYFDTNKDKLPISTGHN